jgi:hypothetical protein
MGRGLSDLQKTILRLALANREAEGDPCWYDVGYVEVLATHFGFEPRWPLRRRDGKRELFGHPFSKAAIGADRYDAAHATLARAVRRLEARGLAMGVLDVEFRQAGVNLTAEGVAVARELSANSVSHGHET